MLTRQDLRTHIFHSITRSLCPECRRVIDAQVLLRDGGVYLRKFCPDHGWHEALVSSDASWYLDAFKYNKPGAVPFDFSTQVERGCPEDCGLCPEHQQHTCVGIIEVTTRCNQDCPTCFADAGGPGYDLTLEQVEFILDRFLETEGRPEVVQISGGEPTIHPQILEILAAAKARDIRHVMLNTNGRRLAQDPTFVQSLVSYEPTIYLQFDGFKSSTCQTLRGQHLLETKEQALDNLIGTGMAVVLVATILEGVNEDELGTILRFALEHPVVRGVSFQPATYAGRCLNEKDPVNRLTVTDVLHLLEEQMQGVLQVGDFLPVPCPHPICTACTYLYVEGEQIVPIPRILNVDDYLDYITNRTIADLADEFRPLLEALWSMAAVMGSDETTSNLSCVACGIDIALPSDLRQLEDSFFMVQVHAFMDEHTFDLQRLMKCCVHELLPDGRAVPFCAYNMLGYRDQVRQFVDQRQL